MNVFEHYKNIEIYLKNYLLLSNLERLKKNNKGNTTLKLANFYNYIQINISLKGKFDKISIFNCKFKYEGVERRS